MPLAVGDKAPAFVAQDTQGRTVSLADFAGKPLVLYFYPKDDTPGCTKEACSFRDAYGEYLAKGIAVLGVSTDDVTSHQQFAAKFSLPFPLLADPDGAIATAYDVLAEMNGMRYAKRVTYVIDASGTIAQVYETVNTATHAADLLAAMAE